MQIRLLDILADPLDQSVWPLKLKILKAEEVERKMSPPPHKSTGLYCKFYCALKEKFLVHDPLGIDESPKSPEELAAITTLEECQVCVRTEVIDGIIYHEKATGQGWYMVSNEIAEMYPPELQRKDALRKFYNTYRDEFETLGLKSGGE